MPTPYVKRMVCLATSRKPGGRCVAGKEIVGKHAAGWVRPVSDRPSGELRQSERWYGQLPEVAVGDVFHISLLGPKPHAYQPENELIDPRKYLGRDSTASYAQLQSCIDSFAGPIWINGPSTRYGVHDQVPEADAPSLGESLKLIRAQDLRVIVEHEWPEFGNKKSFRGSFSINNHPYAFKITDLLIEAEFANHADGTYPIGEALLCISLSEPHKGYAYKLIASVIRKGFYGIA